MAYCPTCKNEWENGLTECPICAKELTPAEPASDKPAWQQIGVIADQMSADHAKEVLIAYDMPAVVISKSGFFGLAGLTLPGFYKTGSGLYDIYVPAEVAEEACDVLDMILGKSWQKKGE